MNVGPTGMIGDAREATRRNIMIDVAQTQRGAEPSEPTNEYLSEHAVFVGRICYSKVVKSVIS